MPNPPIVIGQQGKVLKNERVDVWIDGTSGDDSKDALSQANAVQSINRLRDIINGAVFADECRTLVINLRGAIVLPGGNAGVFNFETSDAEDSPWVRQRVIVDGGTDLDEVLASTATTGSAGGLNEIMALLNDIKTQYGLHLSRGVGVGHPGGADVTNVITAANATDYDTAIALALDLKTQYTAHIADTTPHGSADATNVLSTDDPYDLKSLTDLTNDLKAQYNAHIVDVTGAPPIHDAVGADLATVANATKATAIAGTYLDVAAAGWTINQWRGYWCEFLSGPLAGETYLIRSNDGSVDGTNDRIFFNGDWTLDPGVGSNFRLVRPDTVIDGADPFSFAIFGIAARGSCEVRVQNFRTTNGAILEIGNAQQAAKGWSYLSHIIAECQPFQVFPMISYQQTSWVDFGPRLLDCSTPDCDEVVNPSRLGVSQNADVFAVWFMNRMDMFIDDCVFQSWGPIECQISMRDSSMKYAEYRYCNSGRPTHGGFVRCRIGDPLQATPLPGLWMDSSIAWIMGGVFAGGNHGIEAHRGSKIALLGGMGDNTLTGVYCHSKSVCDQYRSYGAVGNSEITGNSGTVELSEDGVTEVSKWNAIDGLPVSTPDCSAGQFYDENAGPWPLDLG